MARMSPTEQALLEHPSKETRVIHPDDDLLRRYGFKIHSRPRGGIDLWERAGQVFSTREAMRIARHEGDEIMNSLKVQ